MDRLFDLTGKVAVVTGGMGQLGLHYSISMAERGAKVVVLDIVDKPKLKLASFDKLKQDGKIRCMIADITRKSELESVAETIEREWGRAEILINNAALDFPPNAPKSEVGPFEEYPETSFDQVMTVNVKGTVLCCQVFGGHMAVTGGGSIINISSIYGILSPCQDIYEFKRRKGEVYFKPVAYSVSKSAIINLTRYLATYWAKKHVRVNTLTLAGVFNNQDREFIEAYCARIPIGRMADPGDYIGPVVFLASDASRYITGANLVVDGGWSAW
ncbi:MAG: short-chain dehydrogenase [Deltaproteobacteria bacterium RBG_13_47_9]|nr:MAG: short-chain dehydrogenase [Deltaproteobacteria bacterium RBG_13_47_9]